MVMVTLLLAFRLSTLFLLLLAAVAVSAVDPDGVAAPDTEAAALLRLKASLFDPTNALEAWSPSSPSPPCDETHRWPRVQCYNGVLIGLRLARLNLSGDFDFAALSRLPGLHSINLIRNNFSGPLPASLATVRSLRALYLSRNAFTGPVPRDVFAAMSWLKKLYLDRNDFSGVLPADAIAGAPRLQELHLDHNRIEGHVPSKLPATLRLFNVSHNRLTGVLPEAVAARFNESAFAGNTGLCGAPGSDPGACAAASPGPRPLRDAADVGRRLLRRPGGDQRVRGDGHHHARRPPRHRRHGAHAAAGRGDQHRDVGVRTPRCRRPRRRVHCASRRRSRRRVGGDGDHGAGRRYRRRRRRRRRRGTEQGGRVRPDEPRRRRVRAAGADEGVRRGARQRHARVGVQGRHAQRRHRRREADARHEPRRPRRVRGAHPDARRAPPPQRPRPRRLPLPQRRKAHRLRVQATWQPPLRPPW